MKKIRIKSCPVMANGGNIYYGQDAPTGEVRDQTTANSMANSSNPYYKDLGNGSFLADQYSGAWQYPQDTSSWAGYGNDANLYRPDTTGFQGIGNGAQQNTPQQQGAMQEQQGNWHTNESTEGDYSIDAVRSQYGGQYAYGGQTPSGYNGYSRGLNTFWPSANSNIQGQSDAYKVGRTIPKDPMMQKEYSIGSEYDIDESDLQKIKAMGFTFELI